MRGLALAGMWLLLLGLGVASAVRAFPETAHAVVGDDTIFTATADIPRLRQELGKAWEDGASATAKQRLSGALLRLSPLDEAPPTLLAYALATGGRAAEGDKALAIAMKRNPRGRLAHMVAVQRAIDVRDYGRAIRGFETLMRLDLDSEARYMRALAEMARDPASHAAILQEAERRPPWANALVRELGRAEEAGPLLIGLSRTMPEAQTTYLNRLMATRRVEEAFIAWLDTLPPESLSFSWPYDGAFRGAPGVGPFNWSYDRSSTELVEGGGLHVVYLGRGTRDFASQVILLGPGDYRLSTEASGQTRARGGRLQWTITCLPDGPTIAVLEITNLVPGRQNLAQSFDVPATGCSVQRLSLRGMPGELTLWAKAAIAGVRIDTPGPE